MPPAPPPMPPLPLDRAAVDAAIAACLRAVHLIGALAVARARAGSLARQEWRGPTRVRFDTASVRLDLEADELINRLLGTAGAIGDAALAVEAENRRRAEAALEWQRTDHEGAG